MREWVGILRRKIQMQCKFNNFNSPINYVIHII